MAKSYGNIGMDVKEKGSRSPVCSFVSRILYTNPGNAFDKIITVPSLAKFAILRGVGSGGPWLTTAATIGAGGGAFAKTFLPCIAGEDLTVSVGLSNPTYVRYKGNYVLIARDGSNNLVGGAGGDAGSGIGDVLRSGTSGISTSGGASASDLVDDDSLGLFSVGATASAECIGYGAGGFRPSGTGGRTNTSGVLILEFYTSDPRGVIL